MAANRGANRGGIVSCVEPHSLAEYLQIGPGDEIISINGHMLRDEIDFRFYGSEEFIALEIIDALGEKKSFEIEKDSDDLMGIGFADPIFDSMKTCKNNCCFCFISQLPQGMRRSLYVRDDDFRLSFLYGNFISLTNISESDWKRIGEQKLSPLRISLHTSDPCLRVDLMGNETASFAMEQLKRFKQLQVDCHIQIVLLKGINDGEKLLHTLRDLDSLGDTVLSVGVVPAVYTRYRKRPPSPKGGPRWALETISVLEDYARIAYRKRGVHWVYGADEFYFLAGKSFPDYSYYDDFPQFENGIGMTADFREDLRLLTEKPGFKTESQKRSPEAGKALVVTGVMAHGDVVSAINSLGLSYRISACEVRNRFFGEDVTCSGLLTGQDIIEGILHRKGRDDFNCVLIPGHCVFEGRFLDDVTVLDVEAATGLSVEIVEPTPAGLVNAVSEFRGE